MLVSELIEATRGQIFGGTREERNKLSSSITNSATTIPVSYPLSQITRGSRLSIDLEDIYVWDASGLNVTPVDRGQWGSVATTHASGTHIHVNPKFSNWDIFKAINTEIRSLSSPVNGLYQVLTTELTYNPVIEGYDLTGFSLPSQNIIDILEVRYHVTGPAREYLLSSDWELSRSMSDEFTSGMALFIRDAFPNQTVVVKGKFGFTELPPDLTVDVSAYSGVADTALDILSLGAAWRLTSPLEISRNLTGAQGDTRRANEVPAGAELGGARELGRLRDIRIREEAARLSAKYPVRSPRYPFKVG